MGRGATAVEGGLAQPQLYLTFGWPRVLAQQAQHAVIREDEAGKKMPLRGLAPQAIPRSAVGPTGR
eukprot:3537313-Pyramimonas_sp.AAC.1